MMIIEMRLREIGFVLWGHCQNLLDDPRILLRLVTYLQTHKQVFSFFVHKNRDLEASNSLIWRFYEARF